MLLQLAHSPDPDDAFMFWALAKNRIDSAPYQFQHILSDIQTLNEEAKKGRYEISAISFYTYPFVSERYALLPCGASMGDNYGPMIVTRPEHQDQSILDLKIAIPGRQTTAFLALQLYQPRLKEAAISVVPFDQISARVAAGDFDAGLIIHEGQLTYLKEGLVKKVDLGQWWFERHQLPLPLGGNIVRRDLGPKVMSEVSAILQKSIEMGLAHRQEAVRYALDFGRGLNEQLADDFIGMYVNELTVDYGERGRRALAQLFTEARRADLVPEFELKFV